MVFTLLLTVIGFILIFVEEGEYSEVSNIIFIYWLYVFYETFPIWKKGPFLINKNSVLSVL